MHVGMRIGAVLLALFLLPAPSTAANAEFSGTTKKALDSLTVSAEVRTGYDRSLFRHWTDDDGDGCNARYEVLIAEAVKAPRVGSGCRLTGGRWVSAYDGVQTTSVRALDIDHVVPLAEAWDSGAYRWTSDQRRAFANDLGDGRALIAVTASSNRQKSDQDPAEWLPPLARCTYLVDWIAIKVRWKLSVDSAEKQALRRLVTECGLTSIRVTYANVPTSTRASTQQDTTAAGTEKQRVYPGAFCTPRGAIGYSAKNVRYECKPSATEARNRWRR